MPVVKTFDSIDFSNADDQEIMSKLIDKLHKHVHLLAAACSCGGVEVESLLDFISKMTGGGAVSDLGDLFASIEKKQYTVEE